MIGLPVHHHTLLIAQCQRDPDDEALGDELKTFLRALIGRLDMHVLIEPVVQFGRFGFTGIAGIVTSHIAFHYFGTERVLQFDVYSCKPYDRRLLLCFLHDFWSIDRLSLAFLDRGAGRVTFTEETYKRPELDLLRRELESKEQT